MQASFTFHDFRLTSGEILPEVTIVSAPAPLTNPIAVTPPVAIRLLPPLW